MKLYPLKTDQEHQKYFIPSNQNNYIKLKVIFSGTPGIRPAATYQVWSKHSCRLINTVCIHCCTSAVGVGGCVACKMQNVRNITNNLNLAGRLYCYMDNINILLTCSIFSWIIKQCCYCYHITSQYYI